MDFLRKINKQLIFDLDGTLTQSDGEISELTIKILREYSETYPVIIATGKKLTEVTYYINQIKPHKAYAICYGGAYIYDYNNKKELKVFPLDSSSLLKFSHICAVQEVAFSISYLSKDYGYSFDSSSKNILTKESDAFFYDDFYSFLNFIKKSKEFPLAFWIYNKTKSDYKTEKLIELKNSLSLISDFAFFMTKSWNIVISSKDAVKLNAIKWLMEFLNLAQEDCIYFGDGYIDIDCFEYFNTSVCMNSAEEEVKRHAKFITSSSDEEGIFEWLSANKDIL